MSGKKKCQLCEGYVPVARKICDCGNSFSKNKRCYKCGVDVPVAKKKCQCNYVFKQRNKNGFQEIPIVLTPDRLRPTRPIRMKRPLYNDGDYIYNVSMAVLPKQRRCNGRMFVNERHSKLGTQYEQDELYDKALNDAALESIANSIISNSKSNGKNKIEKLYPKRKRNKLTKYQCYSMTSNKRTNLITNKIKKELKDNKKVIDTNKCDSTENVKKNVDKSVGNVSSNSHNSCSNVKKTRSQNGRIPNGLKNLIRGEVSKAIKNKVSNNNGRVNSPIPAYNNELSIKHIKEDVTSDDNDDDKETNTKLNEATKSHHKGKRNLSIERKCEDTSESCKKSKDKSSNICETKETLDSTEKSNCVIKDGTDYENDTSDDDRILVHIKQEKEESCSSKEEEKIEHKTVKKKGGKHSVDPMHPKRPVGRPRKYPHLPGGGRYRKRANAVGTNIEDIVELTKGILTDLNNETDVSDSNTSLIKTPKKNDSDSPTLITKIKEETSPTLDKKEIKRGRPKGCKDTKPRKIRNDYIERMIARKEDVDGSTEELQGTKKKTSKSKSFLSPPSLMPSTKKEKNVENEVLDAAEIERIEKRLDKTNPFIIPDSKKELYSTILDEINRRISSQSFQSSLLLQEI